MKGRSRYLAPAAKDGGRKEGHAMRKDEAQATRRSRGRTSEGDAAGVTKAEGSETGQAPRAGGPPADFITHSVPLHS